MGVLVAALSAAGSAPSEQTSLNPIVNAGERTLIFDWPAIRVGTGEYAEGPTGVTVFHFPDRALAAVDVRGGGPGTVNTDFLRLGYDAKELDTVVFSGGSWYGLENATAAATALKDDGARDGHWTNLALSVGAIIYDFGERRLNEIYPDKRLAQLALRASRPGVFPLGARGAGRFARSGGLFGCNAYSGQGGAFRQVGDVKVAAFVVVNSLGAVTTRDGRVAACYREPGWPEDLRVADLLSNYAASGRVGTTLAASSDDDHWRNTTVSLVVTNQRLSPSELQRLATHVHSSMSRAIQPFATESDGDALFAVSTAELAPTEQRPGMATVRLDVLAAEVMWDAILASVPEQPEAPRASNASPSAPRNVENVVADYFFSPFVTVRVTASGGKLFAQATGARNAYSIGTSHPVELQPVSDGDYTIAGRYPLVIRFEAGRMVLNPGHWQQVGSREVSR
jgi:L-aminopeptidase/D-esterase-like protein